MSHRATRQRAIARAALNRPHLTGTPHVDDDEPRPLAPQPRDPVEHPEITPTHPNWFRVMRVVMSGHHQCIGEHPTLSGAVVMASNELWRAVVQDRHGRSHYNSWRAIKP